MKNREIKIGPRNEAQAAVDRMFLERARAALAGAGYTALEFVAANPGLGMVDLAKLLGRGASALGLTMAVYIDAERAGALRSAASDQLVRKIFHEFPDGWCSADELGALFRLGGWRQDVKRYASGERAGEYATAIVRDLTVDHPPPDGWRPEPTNDPRLAALFDCFWPDASRGQPH